MGVHGTWEAVYYMWCPSSSKVSLVVCTKRHLCVCIGLQFVSAFNLRSIARQAGGIACSLCVRVRRCVGECKVLCRVQGTLASARCVGECKVLCCALLQLSVHYIAGLDEQAGDSGPQRGVVGILLGETIVGVFGVRQWYLNC